MKQSLPSAMRQLFSAPEPFLDVRSLFDEAADTPESIGRSMTSAFLLALGGDAASAKYLERMTDDEEWAKTASLFRDTLGAIAKEMTRAGEDPQLSERIQAFAANPTAEHTRHGVLFPEGVGLPQRREQRVQGLRARRKVELTELNPQPLRDPGRELLFTSNALLTVPAPSTFIDALDCTDELKEHIRRAADEDQLYWYDHPIPIGVQPEANEVLYGLRGLDDAVEFERRRGNMPGERISCVLSTSVTHEGLHAVAKDYIESEIRKRGGFPNLDVYVFTETDTSALIHEVLAPAATELLGRTGAAESLAMFGVDGEYGRHYSFLKAIAALWQVLRSPDLKATFKIDLDQVFPQEELVTESGASAFEHFQSPLWGARGRGSDGRPLELGMIAGALVNERDIHKGLFTPDVTFPEGPSSLEERLFFSKMLMALSTEGELMTRYGRDGIDGRQTCIQRIHVTGGTNGIRVESLRRHRPFTPSFIGRAEDQAYILSVLTEQGEGLAYLHEDGLIMRHDKEAFAADAIKAASFGNLIGDYIRTLYFSEYARVLNDGDPRPLKELVGPFTGCFISEMPSLVVMLRFALRAAGFFLDGEDAQAVRFLRSSAPRLARAMQFACGELREQYLRERDGWGLFYDTLTALETALAGNEPSALRLREKAREIIDRCRVRGGQ